jgi:hypothetical protein
MDDIEFFFDCGDAGVEFDFTNSTTSPEGVSFDGVYFDYTPESLLNDIRRTTSETNSTY